jgi:DNA topoisomerase-2
MTRLLFPEEDMAVMEYQVDEGLKIEPAYYVPILPLILVNGAEGIGTGWSSNVPQYNPLDLIEQIKRKLLGKELGNLKPWYRGYTGEICETAHNQFLTTGRFKITNNDIMEITELPLNKWTGDYKAMLE